MAVPEAMAAAMKRPAAALSMVNRAARGGQLRCSEKLGKEGGEERRERTAVFLA